MGVGAEYCVISCDLGIFADQSAEPVPAHDPDARGPNGRRETPGRWLLAQRPVRAVGVVVVGLFAWDQAQVPLAGDQHPVQALAPRAGDLAFRDGVRSRLPDGRRDDLDPGRGEHRPRRTPC
jgi:hypothetical protein